MPEVAELIGCIEQTQEAHWQWATKIILYAQHIMLLVSWLANQGKKH